MNALFDTRRYLTDFDSSRMGQVVTDTLVIGSGVAGCLAAIAASKYGPVTLLTKKRFDDSCTHQAQGGISVALGTEDSPQCHYEDTLRVGAGLNRARAVYKLVEDAPARIKELMQWGMQIDRAGDRLALGREGGHSVNRIIHAHGDQTGRELSRSLKHQVTQSSQVRIFEYCFLIDLLTEEGECVGAVCYHDTYGHQIIWAKQTVLASGGCGRLWRETTNPEVATGDGPAIAFRAGAKLSDMEFVQFHPTTLYVAGSGRSLITEAVRGEGAYLVDREGNRFMADYHPDAELAPRDVVSRAIQSHLQKTRANCAYLDVRHLNSFERRFPHITQLCHDFQIDVAHDLIPVRPSAHYMIGGVQVNLDGATSIKSLWACGEAACNGVHGANRIASNSLLEGLVFGKVVGENAGQQASEMIDHAHLQRAYNQNEASQRTELDLPDILNSLRSLMWRNVGIVREEPRLSETVDILTFWAHYTLDKTFDDPVGWQIQNQLTTAWLVALSARERSESLGVHYRQDSLTTDNIQKYHVTCRRNESGTLPTRQPCDEQGEPINIDEEVIE